MQRKCLIADINARFINMFMIFKSMPSEQEYIESSNVHFRKFVQNAHYPNFLSQDFTFQAVQSRPVHLLRSVETYLHYDLFE